jgi:PEP-CTERM motif
VPDAENGNVQIRKRRTRRHRRNRLIRRGLGLGALAFFVAGASALILQYFSPSLFQNRQSSLPRVEHLELNHERAAAVDQLLSQPARTIYPYSVVPGGVEDARELKWFAEHDPVVAAHYAGFDYDHAQIVRVTLARTVYVSYRIGNHIYWTRRRIALHKGEKLITDGKITARARCANRVAQTPQQQAAAPPEPPPQKFDQPVQAGTGTAMQSPPVAFQSALLNRPEAPGLGGAGPLSLYDPFVGGNFVPIAPPPLPAGLCAPVKKNGTSGKKKTNPCGATGVPATIPEPHTWILFASGLAAIYWRRRKSSYQSS